MDVSRYEFNCQKALHQGLQYAKSLGHQLLEIEHVALAMLRADNADVTPELETSLKSQLERHLARAPRIFGTSKVLFGQRLNRALDKMEAKSKVEPVTPALFWEELCLQSTVIKTTIARSNEGNVSGSMFQSGVFSSVSGDSVSDAPDREPPVEQPIPEKTADKIDKKLRKFTIDLSAAAERGEIDPVIGRSKEVKRVLEILGRKKKNNPLLIGEPGVGKTAVAEAIAIQIAEGNVPESMIGQRVLTLDLGAMLAGAKFRGEFEDRMKGLLEALKQLEGKIILFIDEIHMIVGAGNQEGGADAANLLKPALARGEIQCLGATTLAEYRKYIEKDAALERRFQPLLVDEPDPKTALEILKGIKSRYEIHHGVKIDDEALKAAVDLSVRYLTSRNLPDKAIDLIDESASRKRIQIESVPKVLEELRGHIHKISIERKALGNHKNKKVTLEQLDRQLIKQKREYEEIENVWRAHQKKLDQMKKYEIKRQEAVSLYENAKSQSNFDFAAKLQYEEIPGVDLALAQIHQELKEMETDHNFLRRAVGVNEVAEAVSVWTNIPVGEMLADDSEKIRTMEARLAERVYGQDEAIIKVSRAVKRARVGVNDPNRPLGVFLFLGPTGVGKTEAAKALAAEMFADEKKMVRIDMSEFMEQHNVSRLIGAPPGYVGYGEGGELTEAIRRKPYSVVLLDEIEKAHPRVLDVLLQVFEDGRITDGNGRTVDCRNTLLIMTSNISLDTQFDPEESSETEVRDALARELRPEFVNRIDEVVVFKRLGTIHLEKLLERLQGELNERLAPRQFRIVLGPTLLQKLIKLGAHSNFGGRAVRRNFQTIVVDAVSDRILTNPTDASGAWILDTDEDDGFVWSEWFDHGQLLPEGE
jgi:ATP-dependent Clp protease ATP-binding subunit ClpB